MSQFLAPALRPEEEEAERSLRPRRLDDFVGQERIKEQLRIALDAAKVRGWLTSDPMFDALKGRREFDELLRG